MLRMTLIICGQYDIVQAAVIDIQGGRRKSAGILNNVRDD